MVTESYADTWILTKTVIVRGQFPSDPVTAHLVPLMRQVDLEMTMKTLQGTGQSRNRRVVGGMAGFPQAKWPHDSLAAAV